MEEDKLDHATACELPPEETEDTSVSIKICNFDLLIMKQKFNDLKTFFLIEFDK